MHTATTTRHIQAHRYHGLAPGPRLIVTAAVHGNEVCGVRAIERVLAELGRGEIEIVRGSATFVPVCNPLAYARGQRMGERNLNRRLLPTDAPRDNEDRLANVLCPLLAAHDVLLDLHSFRSPGRPFVLRGPADNDGALEPFAHAVAEAQLARHVGPSRVVEGWMEAYAAGIERRRARAAAGDHAAAAAIEDPSYGIGTTEYMRSTGGWAITLECGQHLDPNGPEVARLAILRTLVFLGMLDASAVEPHRPAQPPEVLQLHDVIDREDMGDQFAREWASFDAIEAGQLIGTRASGEAVLAPGAGRIVFPNVKSQPGTEWFYLARPSDRRLP